MQTCRALLRREAVVDEHSFSDAGVDGRASVATRARHVAVAERSHV
jgi:hypothetical protein